MVLEWLVIIWILTLSSVLLAKSVVLTLRGSSVSRNSARRKRRFLKLPFKCKNPQCGRTFLLPARISMEKKPLDFTSNATRIVVEKSCCPYCECIEFEEAAS